MKAPFSNSFYENHQDDDYMDDYDYERIQEKKEIAALVFDDMLNKERENVVAPDTTGVDFFFLMDFITDDMSSDFAFIEQDFLKNCRGRLDEFQNVGWYGERSFRTSRPRYAMQNNVLRLIYNGAKIGDDYCLELIKNLYKVYHKKEYKQLKRFSKINPDEIFSLSEDEYEDSDHCSIGRIMGMCQFMGIELHENCSFMYKLLNNKREDYLAAEEEATEY